MSNITQRLTPEILLLLIVLILLSLVTLTAPLIVRADTNVLYAAPDEIGSGNCSSWANACILQTALSTAVSGQEIWVKAGAHYPSISVDRDATFTLKNGVSLYGGFAGTETNLDERNWQINLTILSGDIDGNDTNIDGNDIAETVADIQGFNAYHVISSTGTDSTAILDGFIVNAGQSNSASPPHNTGGGMVNISSSPTLTNVTFNSNFAYSGAGMFNNDSSPTLTNVTFSNNSVTDGSGGGIYNYNSSPTLANVTFRGNSVTDYGGGVFNNNSSSPTLTNVTFSGNSANYGGGIFNESSNPTLINVTFNGNSAFYGGGIFNNNSSCPTLTNVVMWGNITDNKSEIYNNSNTPPSTPSIAYSDIQGCGGSGSGWDTTCGTNDGGNIDADPLFMDAAAGNLRLQQTSPAIDAGDNAAVPGGITTDLDGKPRFIDVLTVPDTGKGTPPIVDMGAYEYVSSPVSFPLTVDIVGNGSVIKNPDQIGYYFGETVTLTATADPGWAFTGWSGDASGSTNPLTVQITDNTNITATFTQNEHALSVTVDPEGMGSVAIDPVKETYHYGDTVTLTPAANPLWYFSDWSGDALGTDNPLTLTIQGDTNITAHFLEYFEIYLPLIMRN